MREMPPVVMSHLRDGDILYRCSYQSPESGPLNHERIHERGTGMSQSKYRNIKIVIDGITFDSKKEGNRYVELKLLKQAGEVIDFFCQPVFLLQEKFRNGWTGKGEREIKYVADFAVKFANLNHWVVEDVKGGKVTQTKDFLLKRKLFLKRYACLELRLL